MATGGIFTWKDGRENPDTCLAAIMHIQKGLSLHLQNIIWK